jgi:uncharacterized membrane protein
MRARAKVAVAAAVTSATAALVALNRARHNGTRRWPLWRDGRYVTLRGVTVDRPVDEVYAFWADPQRLVAATGRRGTAERLDERQVRWSVAGPVGRTVSWVTELTVEEPPHVLGWRSVSGPMPHEGRAEFTPAPGNRGTELRVGLTYQLPAGRTGAAVARLTGDDPDQLLRTALRRAKQLMEAGDIVTVDGQVSGRGPLRQRITEYVDHRLATGGRP